MGLLDHIEKTGTQKEQNIECSFFDFCNEHNFSTAAIFSRFGDTFVITKSIGLDATSIVTSVSSKDFWDGTIGFEKTCRTYKNEGLVGFYQLFSKELKEKIATLHFSRTNDDSIFMNITSKGFPESLLPVLSNYTFIKKESEDFSVEPCGYEAQLLLLSTNNTISNILENANLSNAAVKTALHESLYTSFFVKISQTLERPNFCTQGKNGEIKIVLFSNSPISEELLQHHLINFSENFFDNLASKLILIKAGKSSSIKEIESFCAKG